MNTSTIFKHQITIYGAFLVFTTLILLFIHASSPLVGYNPGYSPNLFLTIGRGMFEGFVPYRDMWDGKGIVAFLLPGLANQIIPNPYTAQWILSCFVVSTAGFYLYKLASTLLSEGKNATAFAAAALVLSLSLAQARCYVLGAVSDEYAMLFLSASLYYLYKLLDTNKLSIRDSILLGLFLGLLFWTKFTLLAAPGILTATAFLKLLNQESFKAAIQNLLPAGLVFVVMGLAVVLYFAANNALPDLYYGYYLFHKLYHPHGSVHLLIGNLRQALFLHPCAFFILGVGFADLALNIKKDVVKHTALLLGVVAQTICVYMGSSYHYYFLNLIPFTMFGIIVFVENRCRIAMYATLALAVISSHPTWPESLNGLPTRREMREMGKEVRILADICKKKEQHKVLLYRMFDNGIFLYMRETPVFTYFHQANVDPVGHKQQAYYLQERLPDFILIDRSFSQRGLETTREGEPYTNVMANGGYRELPVPGVENPRFMLFERVLPADGGQ